MQERIAKWDTAKFILIILVVFGHLLVPFSDMSTGYQSLFFIIYTFHMPAFMFVSGLFSKKTVDAEVFQWRKLIPFLLLCFFCNFIRYFTFVIFDPEEKFSIFKVSNVSWYLFVLFAVYVISYLVRRVRPAYVMIISLIIACLFGLDPSLKYFSLYRITTLFPFFYLGYCLNIKRLEAFLNRKMVRFAAALILAAFVISCFVFPQVLQWRTMITGANSYQTVAKALDFTLHPLIYPLLKLGYFALSGIVVISFFAVVPNFRIPVVTRFGSRTLAVYVLHFLILEPLIQIPALKTLAGTNAVLTAVLLFLLAIAIVMILSLRVFTIPFEWLMKVPLKPGSDNGGGKPRHL